MPALGERFRAAREARGLTLSDVSEQIRIRSVYLAAIEEENWSTIGAPVYIRGFLKTYARFLGLDAEETVGLFNRTEAAEAATSVEGPEDPARPPGRTSSRNLTPFLWLASVVAVALIAFVVYNELTMQPRSVAVVSTSAAPSALPSINPTAQASTTSGPLGASPGPSASGSAGPEASAAPGAGGPGTIQVVLTAPSWLRMTVDGNVSMEGTFPAGTAKLFHGKAALLRIGNAGGVDVYVDGKSMGKLGIAGAVAERSFTL